MHVSGDTETCREHFQLGLERPFTGNKEFGVRVIFFKDREGTKAGGNAFLWNETAGPCSSQWCFPALHRPLEKLAKEDS